MWYSLENMEHNIYIGLGTNLGERETNLRDAVNALAPKISVLAKSLIYETAPWGFSDQPKFLNQVIAAKTYLSSFELLAYLKNIETYLGRKETFRNGPRVIDLDILFYDNCVVQEDQLNIPHPRLHLRAFVLVPLVELAPKLQHPVLGCTMQALLHSLGREGVEQFHPSEFIA